MKFQWSSLIPTPQEWQDFLKHEPKYLLYDIVGSFIYAFGVYTFANEADFAPGGVTGLAMILNYILDGLLPIGTLSILVNIPILFFAVRHLSGMYLIRTFQTLIMNAVFLDFVVPIIPCYQINVPSDNLLAALAAGAISGIGLAIMYSAGTCTGGSDLIIMSLRKIKPHMSLGQLTALIDGSIIVLGMIAYKNVNALIYGIIFTVVFTVVMDKILVGIDSGKVALVISDQPTLLWQEISSKLGRGGTFLYAEGAYSAQKKKVLMVACSNKQVPDLRKIIGHVDPKALTIILDYTEALGEGFNPSYLDKQF